MIVTVQIFDIPKDLYQWKGRLINMTGAVSRLTSFSQHKIVLISILNRVKDENYWYYSLSSMHPVRKSTLKKSRNKDLGVSFKITE